MTQEEKDLLLKDLCARLPYGVKTTYHDTIMEIFVVSVFLNNMCCLRWDSHKGYYNQTNAHIGEFKPYLRPMSSMTEEEFKEYHSMLIDVDKSGLMNQDFITKVVDWLDKKMFDHRNLVPKGLALEAPKNMYK